MANLKNINAVELGAMPQKGSLRLIDMYNLQGGIAAWMQAGLPVEA